MMKAIFFDPEEGFVAVRVLRDRLEPYGKATEKDVAGEGWFISYPFIDLYASCPDPGYEYREDIQSFIEAAYHGGFGKVFVRPDTKPPMDNAPMVREFLKRSRNSRIQIQPMPAFSQGLEGKRMTEIGELSSTGVKFLSNGEVPVRSDRFLRRVMEYASSSGLILALTPYSGDLHEGVINEGPASARLGLSPVAWVDEAIAISRYCFLAELTGARIHITKVTTRAGIEEIKRAKGRGVQVTATTPFYHLFFTDQDMSTFDQNLVTKPPLRGREDQNALIDALIEGTIQGLVTDHTPVSRHEKELEIEYAVPGMTGLDLAVPLVLDLAKQGRLPLDVAVRAFTSGPASVLLENPEPSAGYVKVLMEDPWVVDSQTILSKSKNTPFMGRTVNTRISWLDI